MDNKILEQLVQLKTVTWDGDLINKDARDICIKNEWSNKCDGFNYITYEGIKILIKLQEIHP